jgi:ubiquinone/menaquinone biosynthesis C-methylase UbiE
VVGLDLNAKLIDQARAAAHAQGIDNVKFEVGDILTLPYADDRFDLVFSHALLEHLPRPMDGLAQMRRVLKPGGWIALRVPDWGANIQYPEGQANARFAVLFEQQFRHGGSDPYRGRQVGEMLYALGFEDVRITASFTNYGTPEDIAGVLQIILEHFLGGERASMMLENGWTTQAELERLRADLTEWANTPGAFQARAWVEAVARKP